MKIMSLNVNQFQVLRLSEGYWAKDIIALVKRFLSMDPDNIVFLYEIPSKFCGDDSELSKMLDPYRVEAAEKAVTSEGKDRSSRFCTIAVTVGGGKWKREDSKNSKEGFIAFSKKKKVLCLNRFVEMVFEDGSESKLRLLGVHTPLEQHKDKEKGYNYDEDVLKVFTAIKEYAIDCENKSFILLGDLNVDEKECVYLEQINDIINNNGYSDKITENQITFFTSKNGTTPDHVLVSPELKDKVTAYVIPQEILELSDHAVIIVDVKM